MIQTPVVSQPAFSTPAGVHHTAVKVLSSEGRFVVMVNSMGQPLEAGGVRSESRMAVMPDA